MKLVKPRYEILFREELKTALKKIELAARTCYKSEDKITEDDSSAIQLCKTLKERKHEAMFEFADMIVKFIVPRGFTHEMVRHRLCSFAQESTRYCNYSKDKFHNQVTFIIPPQSQLKEGVYPIEWDEFNLIGNCTGEIQPTNTTEADHRYFWSCAESERNYLRILERCWTAQEARDVLPIGLKTEIVVKANLREWMHIFRLRTSSKAHPVMQEVMRPLLWEVKQLIPVLFDDIDTEFVLISGRLTI